MFSELSTIVLKMENKTFFPSNLFRSSLRRRLLALFLTNPESRYYIRQLHAMFGGSVGSLHRELRQLEDTGVLTSERVGNLRFYYADKRYPLFKELTAIVAKTVGVEGTLRSALLKVSGIDIAFIYGSFASGTESGASDVDLFVIGDFDLDLFNTTLTKVEKRLAREVNYTVMSTGEFAEEYREGLPLVVKLLAEPKVFLIGDVRGLEALT